MSSQNRKFKFLPYLILLISLVFMNVSTLFSEIIEIDPLLVPETLESPFEENHTREKKELTPDKTTKLITMLFPLDENTLENPMNLTTTDFILRLQEKYEYTLCEAYTRAVPDIKNNFFLYDTTIVEPLEGDETYVQEKKDKTNMSLEHRYRMYNESCDPQQEWWFWYEMFVIAQNDTNSTMRDILPLKTGHGGRKPKTTTATTSNTTETTVTTTPPPTKKSIKLAPTVKVQISHDDDIQLQFTPQTIMVRWNEVWIKYKNKAVCNQKLLLECLQEEVNDPEYGWIPKKGSKKFICQCRKHGIGLPTVLTPLKVDNYPAVQKDAYTTVDYYDDIEFINDQEVRHYGSYRHTLRCAVQANLPNSQMDVPITNPCDFFLPMIGMCRASCVENASCASVDGPEKLAMKKKAGNNEMERIVKKRLHQTYHNKCVCKMGTHCRKVSEEEFAGGDEVKASVVLVIQNLVVYWNVRKYYSELN